MGRSLTLELHLTVWGSGGTDFCSRQPDLVPFRLTIRSPSVPLWLILFALHSFMTCRRRSYGQFPSLSAGPNG